MKTFFLITIGLFSVLGLSGQRYTERPLFDFKTDTSKSLHDYLKEMPSLRIDPLPESGIRDFTRRNGIILKKSDPRDRVFPGASKYYAIRSFPGVSYSDRFIIKPDTTNKYYLIIVNPLDTLLRR